MELASESVKFGIHSHRSFVYSISCGPLWGSGRNKVWNKFLCSGVGVQGTWGEKKRPARDEKRKAWLTKTVSGVVKVMGSATSTAWHIQSGRPAIDSNLLPVRASSKMSSRRESAVNSTYLCKTYPSHYIAVSYIWRVYFRHQNVL